MSVFSDVVYFMLKFLLVLIVALARLLLSRKVAEFQCVFLAKLDMSFSSKVSAGD